MIDREFASKTGKNGGVGKNGGDCSNFQSNKSFEVNFYPFFVQIGSFESTCCVDRPNTKVYVQIPNILRDGVKVGSLSPKWYLEQEILSLEDSKP